MTADTDSGTRTAVEADVDPVAFRALDRILANALEPGGPDVDLEAVRHTIERNPIEAGPLRALGTSTGDADLRERLAILRRAYPALKRQKEALRIEASLLPETFELYIPLARFMAARARQIRAERGRAAVFGINGGQGSGKTTINGFLQTLLGEGLGLRSAGFSIDDVYKTYDERQAMARSVHPLFAVRSVAGTHDTRLARATLESLVQATAETRTPIPRFDKMARGGEGDRLPEAEWPVVEGPVDLVIFEGWFVGAGPQPQDALVSPVNDRERLEDPDGAWRTEVNRLLDTDYRALFDRIDDLFVIQVRSMEDVYRNRELQEQHLRRELEATRRRGEELGGRGAMTPEQVVAFISLYERTTRQMLRTLPERARVTLYLGDHHRVERVRVNTLDASGQVSPGPAPANREGG